MSEVEFYKLFNGDYEISKCGQVRRRYKNSEMHYLKPYLNSSGFYILAVNIKQDGKNKKYPLHRLLALTFINNRKNKRCVDHINQDKNDNRLINLRWVSDSEKKYNRKKNRWIRKWKLEIEAQKRNYC